MNNMVMNIVEMTNIIAKIDEAIQRLENEFKDLNNRVKEIDGSSDLWSGDEQNAAYKCYVTIANDFPRTIEQLKSLRIFLENALNSYMVGDSVLNKSVENNNDGLDIK